MSTNLQQKDKIILELAGKPPGRISLDASDSKGLADLFSRAQPGDEFKGTFTATLDEAGSKNITLSIQEFEVEPPEDEGINPMQAIADQDKEEQEEGEGSGDSAAVTMLKNDDGVSEGAPGSNDDNLPVDILGTH